MSSTTENQPSEPYMLSAWRYSELQDLPQPIREVFEKYSHVSPEQVIQHIEALVSAHCPLDLPSILNFPSASKPTRSSPTPASGSTVS